MIRKSLSVSVALSTLAAGLGVSQAAFADFLSDSKLNLSARNFYFNNDNREGGADQKEWAQGFKLDYISGFTAGTVGFGVDAQALYGVHLDGGKGHHPDNNSFFPSDSDGSSEHEWARIGGNLKARFSKTELHVGSALAPVLPILISNDGRLLPATFDGGILTSKEINNLTLVAGQLEHSSGRASSNSTGLAIAGGTQESNKFRFAGGDWKVTNDLLLQYYYANLEDYYKQNFLGLVHNFKIAEDQSFKTDLRYFDSSSDGKNGDVGYRFNNNGGYAKNPGEVDNQTWSAMFTYQLGGNSFMLGHQSVGGDGGFVWLNQGSLPNEGNGGSSFYLFTDSMINQFARAGEKTNFGQYSYDFARLGVPGLKASISYLRGNDIKDAGNGSDHHEWERDMSIAYVIPTGPLKGLGTTLRQGTYRGAGVSTADQDQTRLIFNYTYAFF
jgi:hypothetical protein